jgi:hypothetical protein
MPGEEDDALDELIHAELARRGHTLDSWAAELQAQAEAAVAKNRRARRMRAVKIAAVGAAGIAAAAGVVLALHAVQEPTSNSSAPHVKLPAEPMGPPDAGPDASRRR